VVDGKAVERKSEATTVLAGQELWPAVNAENGSKRLQAL